MGVRPRLTTGRAGPIFALMRGVGTIILCLAVLLTSAVPAFAAYGLVHPHGVSLTEAAPAHSPSAHAGHASPEEAADSAISGLCVGGEGIHCGAALTAAVRSEVLLRLPRHAGVRLPPHALGTHRTPETEAPPPRV